MSTSRFCPRCGKAVPAAATTLPFCSRQCKMADLGAWLGEEYRIPGTAPDDADAAASEDKPDA